MAQGKTYTDFGRPLEQAVFQSTSKYFKVGKSEPMENTEDNVSEMGFHKSSSDQQNIYQQTGNVNCCMNKACWWSPSQDSLPVDFCHSSSIHGLSFIGRPKTHLTEKIFWTIGFILGALGAVILINNVWQRHYKNPVIVSFQAQEVETDTIPFPSVTICNMNAFPKSKVRLFEQLARGTGPMAKTAKEYLKYVRSICNAQRSFAEEFKFASRRGINGHPAWNFTIPEDSQDEMMDFLLDHTIPCNHLIRLCMLGEKKADCEGIFKPVITDYGKCCTFNILPVPLLMRNPKTVARKRGDDMSNPELHPALGKTRRWSKEEIESWRLWNYGVDGFSVPNKSLPQPFRQRRAGIPYGLSILVDANLDDWYCPVSDAEGFRFLLHNPLEIPHIDEFASVLDLNKEIFIEVHPEVTNADDDIRDIQLKDRDCYFPKEMQLKFFQPYTGGNCIDECTAIAFRERCNCTQFYMPRGNNTNICNMDPGSDDYECINEAKRTFINALLETMKTECGYCYPLCEDVEYHFETTMSTLQESKTLWLDPDPEHEKEPEWYLRLYRYSEDFDGK